VKVLYGLDAVEPLSRSVLTVGNFDGVHLAHRQLLKTAQRLAAECGAPAVALTFEPHPLTVVAPDRAPPRLASPDDKLRYMAEAGIEQVVVAKSEPRLLTMEAEAFVEEILVSKFHPVHVVEGPSFGFGRGRRGDPELLRRAAGRFQCTVHIVEPVHVEFSEGERVMVSSSLIRQLLSAGRVQEAAVCLGRPYAVIGNVERGHARGKGLGFPTANLATPDQLVPGEGVYAGRAQVGNEWRLTAISIGRNPTFGGTELCTEAFLLDWERDLYGRRIRLEFGRFLRPQQRFASAADLAQQLQRDVAAVRAQTSRGS
jgi:riboflavin kinase/FMN adenylyltransferase